MPPGIAADGLPVVELTRLREMLPAAQNAAHLQVGPCSCDLVRSRHLDARDDERHLRRRYSRLGLARDDWIIRELDDTGATPHRRSHVADGAPRSPGSSPSTRETLDPPSTGSTFSPAGGMPAMGSRSLARRRGSCRSGGLAPGRAPCGRGPLMLDVAPSDPYTQALPRPSRSTPPQRGCSMLRALPFRTPLRLLTIVVLAGCGGGPGKDEAHDEAVADAAGEPRPAPTRPANPAAQAPLRWPWKTSRAGERNGRRARRRSGGRRKAEEPEAGEDTLAALMGGGDDHERSAPGRRGG